MLLVPQMDDLPNRAASMQPVATVSARSKWNLAVPLSGTVNGIAAATEGSSANAILIAALADTAGTGIASLKCIQIPANCSFLELGASGDGAIGTAPVVELYRSHHPNVSAGVGAGVGQAIPAGEEDWERLYSVLGNGTTNFGTTANDVTGTAGAARYSLDEGTYQNRVFAVRGARMVVVRVLTIGTTNKWSLKYRFF